jgi:quercetin dioxygenase-like cupin family protein
VLIKKLKYFAFILFTLSCSTTQTDTDLRSPNYPVRTRAEQTDIHEDWGHLTWLAGTKYGNAEGLVLGRVTLKAGMSNPRHRHPRCEEVLYMLQGKIVHSIGDENYTLTAGDTLTIPAGVFHGAKCTSEEDADMIVAYSEGIRLFEPESTNPK